MARGGGAGGARRQLRQPSDQHLENEVVGPLLALIQQAAHWRDGLILADGRERWRRISWAALIVLFLLRLPDWTASGALHVGDVLTPVFDWLWPFLERRNLNPSKPIKNAIGLAFTGLSFLALELAKAECPSLIDAEHRATLSPLLSKLPAREQTILHLRFFEGLTQSEIASRLGISQMHVSRLLARSLAQLRDAAE